MINAEVKEIVDSLLTRKRKFSETGKLNVVKHVERATFGSTRISISPLPL